MGATAMSPRSPNGAPIGVRRGRGGSAPRRASIDPTAPSAAANPAQGEKERAGVDEIQRGRITAAMSELVREHGVGGVTVAHVVARSGVSRRTFYELYRDREDCFLAALDRAIEQASELVLPAYRAGEGWQAQVAGGLEAALCFFDSEPDLAYLCVVGALGAGPRALERRASIVQALVDAIHEGRTEVASARRPNRLVAEGVVGAVLAIVYARLLEQRPPQPLAGLLSQLMALIVLPYLGARAADRELRRPAPRRRPVAQRRVDPLRELDMRLTYRTVRVLLAIGSRPASSNRQVASAAGITDQGQTSKLLARLQALGLIANTGGEHSKGEPNAWNLTHTGEDVQRALQSQSS